MGLDVFGCTEKMKGGTADCLDIVLAIILPPLGVFLKFGCEVEFWICLLLTLLGYLPGIIYAVYAITK
ncbi:Hydrophobic protein like [Quillaja saponaria]|uniref:Hydrophobic protein like n=1 Tax=Quillaja saponaria TaxID=32244 RepID=A0AAD7VJ80_QUISA|nr:Hydrophobic protein like [Quillaja saponaria]